MNGRPHQNLLHPRERARLIEGGLEDNVKHRIRLVTMQLLQIPTAILCSKLMFTYKAFMSLQRITYICPLVLMQWAAVRTNLGEMRVPPQEGPAKSWRLSIDRHRAT